MKLDDNLKGRIDEYFAGVTAEELYRTLVDKYNFTEDDVFSQVYGEFMSYASAYKIVKGFTSIDVEFMEDSDSKMSYAKECTIPLAA